MQGLEKYRYVSKETNDNTQNYMLAQMTALALLGFLIPFFIGGPQILVGILVNALIIRSAISLPAAKTLPVIFTPSIGALAHGVLFGPFSMFLVFMMPFIWAGNAVLVYAFRRRIRNIYGYSLALVLGAAAKAGLLYASAFILYSVSIIPSVFLSAMGAMQLATALLGGIVAYLELKAERCFV